MIFRAISVCNVGPFRGVHRFELAYSDGSSPAITLIGGLNGSGKTSLLNAVMFALYGQRSPTRRHLNQSYSEFLEGLAHRGAMTDAHWVTLDLYFPDGILVVRRSFRRSRVRWVDELNVQRDGQPDPIIANGWDAYIEERIPADLARLFFFDGEQIGAIAETDTSLPELQQAVRQLLGITVVDRTIRDLERLMRRTVQGMPTTGVKDEIQRAQVEWDRLNDERHRIDQDLAKIRADLERTQSHLRDAQSRYSQLGGSWIRNSIDLERQRAVLREWLGTVRVGLETLAAGPYPLLMLRNELHELNTMIQRRGEATAALHVLPFMRARNQAVRALLNSFPEQLSLPLRAVDELLARQEAELIAATRAGEQGFSVSTMGQQLLQDLLAGLGVRLSAQVHVQLREWTRLNDQIDQIDRHLQTDIDDEAVTKAERELSEWAKHFAELHSLKVDAEERSRTVVRNLSLIEKRLHDLAQQVSAVSEAERIVQFGARALDALRRFRSSVVEQRMGRLQDNINQSLQHLLRKRSWVARVVIDPESFQVTLRDRSGASIPKSSLSSGEKQMLALAILWGLAQTTNRRLPVIIDTPLARLDSTHRDHFVTRYLPHASDQVIVLSTDTEITGVYLRQLGCHVRAVFQLDFDEATRSTQVRPSYFGELVGS